MRRVAHINKSLLTLGKVIYALSEKTASPSGAGAHIPYRDSKLTRILQNSLSGNARVAVVCTINPNPAAVDESLSTLNFAKRIKKVGLHARRNEVESSGGIGAEAQALILRYQTEADALRKMVEQLQTHAAVVEDERIRELQERLDVIGSLVVRGGRNDTEDGSDDEDLRHASTTDSTPATSRSTSHSSAYARPVSPTKRHNFGFDDPPHLLAEKLFLANRKIDALTRQLASRPEVPATSVAQASLISSLQRQISELEAVCEAQATDAPPKIREDVEREFSHRLTTLSQKLAEKDAFISSLQEEGARLRRVNEKLMELAHQQTRDMVENLSPARKPLKPTENTPLRRAARPMSLFNPTPAFDLGALRTTLETVESEGKRQQATKRRSISNDYTLLQLGTHEIEQEIEQKSASIPASETFAVLPAFGR